MFPELGDESNKKVVLLVEDSPTQALNLHMALEDLGLKVICAVNGTMGVRLAQQIFPDAIVLDVVLPDFSGFEVCKYLKQSPVTQDIPIIMLTRENTPEAFTQGIELGAIDYIPKDVFALAVLKETLHQMGIISTEMLEKRPDSIEEEFK